MDVFDLTKVNNLMKLCEDNYPQKTLTHVIRVANYALHSALISKLTIDRTLLYFCALAHDLIEDTSVSYEEISEATGYCVDKLKEILRLLTHETEKESYIDYIKSIRESENIIAYIVKLADMKDHLILLKREDNGLSPEVVDKLKKKYEEALPYLL